MEKFENRERGTNAEKCENGFPSPGGFSNSLLDLIDESSSLKNNHDSIRREERIEAAIANLASHADLLCDGKLSKTELELFGTAESLPPSVKDLTQHLLDNFAGFARFSKENLEEISNPHARKIAETIFPKDRSSENFISAADLKGLKSLSPMALPFLEIQAREQKHRELDGLPESERSHATHELYVFLDSKLQERKKLFNWK